MAACETKGFLSFLILWLVKKRPMTGNELAVEMKRRKGHKPSPGTIYPALKALKDKGLLTHDGNKRYALTPKGERELMGFIKLFFSTFCDLEEMRTCSRK